MNNILVHIKYIIYYSWELKCLGLGASSRNGSFKSKDNMNVFQKFHCNLSVSLCVKMTFWPRVNRKSHIQNGKVSSSGGNEHAE